MDFTIAGTVLAAYADRLRPIRAGEVAAHITAVPTPGHTPGHTAWLIDSEGERLLIWGDVVHLPAIHFALPRASVVHDLDSDAAAATRRVLDMVATERIPVAGVHLDLLRPRGRAIRRRFRLRAGHLDVDALYQGSAPYFGISARPLPAAA